MPAKDIDHLQGRRTVARNTPRESQMMAGSLEKSAAEHRATLEKIRKGGIATGVRILANHDSCPVCKAIEGAYDFDEVPELPIEACSHPNGCRCVYEPVLDRFGP